MSFGLQGEMERVTQGIFFKAEDTIDNLCQALIDILHTSTMMSCHENGGKKRQTDLSNMPFPPPSSFLHYYILCKHCHLVVTSAIIYLFVFLFHFTSLWGGGEGGDASI